MQTPGSRANFPDGNRETATGCAAQRGVDTVDKDSMRLAGLAALGGAGGVRECYEP